MADINNSDPKIPIPKDWDDSVRYFLHDRYKPFNVLIIVFAMVAGFRILFSPSNTELNTIQEINIFSATIKVTLQFTMFIMIIFAMPCIIHFNVLITKLLDKVGKK